MDDDRAQFLTPYAARFAEGFGFITLITLLPYYISGLLGVADSLREPASMALFADEGTSEGGAASGFGFRELVWRPGSVIAPLLGGWLMTTVSMASVLRSIRGGSYRRSRPGA